MSETTERPVWGRTQSLSLLAVLVVAAAYWGLYFALTFESLSSPDQLDYANIGRHLLRGDGFITNNIYTLNLTRFPEFDAHPEFHRAPGFAVLVAGAEALFGFNDHAVASVAGISFILTAGLVYAFGWHLSGGEQRSALLGAGLVLLNQALLQVSAAGLADLPFAFYLTLLVFMLWWQSPPVLLGVALGLGYLLRYNLAFFMPGFLLFWWFERPEKPVRYLAWLIASGFLTVLPWLIRNTIVGGSPFFAWNSFNYIMGTPDFPGQELFRMLAVVDVGDYVRSHPTYILDKVIDSARFLYNELPGLTNLFVMGFFVVGLFVRADKPHRAFVLQWAIVAMAAMQAVAILPMEHEKTRLFLPFIPLLIIYAARLYDHLVAALVRSRWAQVALLLAALGYVAVGTLPDFGGYVRRSDFLEMRDYLSDSVLAEHPDALLISDAPWVAAWYLDRPAVNVPKFYTDFVQVEAMAADREVFVYLHYIEGNDRYGRVEEYAREYFDNPDFTSRYAVVEEFATGQLLYQQVAP